MAFQYTDFENKILDLVISTTSSKLLSNRVILGGVTGSGGGGGGPWVPPVGQLQQTKVCYDLSEVSTGAIPVSGRSLLDNLNRIRYGTTIRPGYIPTYYSVTTSGTLLQHLAGIDESLGSGISASGMGHIIQEEGVSFPFREHLNFTGLGVTITDDPTENATDVSIDATSMSVNIPVSPLPNGVISKFTVSGSSFSEDTLIVFVNGQMQTEHVDFEETIPSSGTFTFLSGSIPQTSDVIRTCFGLASETAGGHTIQDTGVAQTQRSNLNFVGATVADDAVNDATVVTIANDYICLQDQKAQNTNGGTFTLGAWRTRDLNTEVADDGGHCSLVANQFTLATGTYRIHASAPGFYVTSHQAILYNITDASVTLVGTSEVSYQGDSTQTRSHICGQFTIAAPKVFEIQHRCDATYATYGFGHAANFTTEVYTIVELWKVV